MDRPWHIDLPFADSRTSSRSGSRAGYPSPRIHHFDGDVPPSMSPLDAIAAQSRKLAKELEETRLAGQRRMSRLPPQVVTKSLSQHQANRPAIFRSLSNNSQEAIPPVPHIETDVVANNPDITAPRFRPTSTYPRISAVLGSEDQDRSQTSTPTDSYRRTDSKAPSLSNESFGPGRVESPELAEHEVHASEGESSKISGSSGLDHSFPALAPPNAAFARHRPYHESSDDDYTSSNAGSFFSQTRKLSSSSNISLPLASSITHNRSPSNNSSSSLPGHKKTPSHFNFSRPRSAASSHVKVDSPTKFQHHLHRKDSQGSELNRHVTSFDEVRSVSSDGFLSQAPSSYTHSRFVLPRGRNVDRNSGIFAYPTSPNPEGLDSISPISPSLSTQQDVFHDAVSTPLEAPSRGRSSERPGSTGFSFEFEVERPTSRDRVRRPSSSHTQASSVRSNNSNGGRPFHSHAQKVPDLPPIPGSTYAATTETQSSRSNSTVRPSTSRSVSNYANMTPEDHVVKAIHLHQHGDLKESTYHLRIAAKQNHATGMLLYALACRHGWGMRTNPKEGVAWLKKAVDSAMLDVAEDEDETSDKPKSDFHQKKEHKAQFALGIYELGVSHLNGWGVEVDKALALRCFEIAGTWGDPDALTEAGFCYSEGIGCKKDLKKAARFYRMAADKGVSMVGNSWIYKEKYNDPKDAAKDGTERGRGADSPKKGSSSAGRSKSKSRGLFARKKA